MSPVKAKEGPMACQPEDFDSFGTSLQDRKTDCLQILLTFKGSNPNEKEWLKEGDEPKQAPKTAKDKAALPLAKQIVKNKRGVLIFPPAHTRLSDELVYLATKFVKVKERAERYPYDFDTKGDIDPERVPSGVGPLVWAHGLPFYPVYKGYYILTGRAHASEIGWKLNDKGTPKLKSWPIWVVGPVVAPPPAVRLERQINRQLLVYKAEKVDDFEERGLEKAIAARDVVSSLHTHGTVFPMENGFIIAPLHRFKGYHVRVGPEKKGVRVGCIGPAFSKENGIHGDYYEVASKVPYSNEPKTGVKDGGFLVGNAHYLNETEDYEMEDVYEGDQEEETSNQEVEGADDHDEDEWDHSKATEKASPAAERIEPKTEPKAQSPVPDDHEPVPEPIIDKVFDKHGEETIPVAIQRNINGDEATDYDNEVSGPGASIDQAQETSDILKETEIKVGVMEVVAKSSTTNDDTVPAGKEKEFDEKMVEG